jgi:hypothetical protein
LLGAILKHNVIKHVKAGTIQEKRGNGYKSAEPDEGRWHRKAILLYANECFAAQNINYAPAKMSWLTRQRC